MQPTLTLLRFAIKFAASDFFKHPEPAKKESVLWHVKDQASWEKACPKAGWCFVTFLDSQSEDHERYTHF